MLGYWAFVSLLNYHCTHRKLLSYCQIYDFNILRLNTFWKYERSQYYIFILLWQHRHNRICALKVSHRYNNMSTTENESLSPFHWYITSVDCGSKIFLNLRNIILPSYFKIHFFVVNVNMSLSVRPFRRKYM